MNQIASRIKISLFCRQNVYVLKRDVPKPCFVADRQLVGGKHFELLLQGTKKPSGKRDQLSDAKKTAPLRALLEKRLGKQAAREAQNQGGPQLRDQLLSLDPLDTDWVKQVNKACIWHLICPYHLQMS